MAALTCTTRVKLVFFNRAEAWILSGKEAIEPRWSRFGRHYLLRIGVHILAVYGLWSALLYFDDALRHSSAIQASGWFKSLTISGRRYFSELSSAIWPGVLTLACVGWSWASTGVAVPLAVSLALCLVATTAAGLMARFAVPERISDWIAWAGPSTARDFQISALVILAAVALLVLFRRMTAQYEKMSADRLALSPAAEDRAIRALVQSMVLVLITAAGFTATWIICNARPLPAVAAADLREQKPSVLIFAVDGDSYSSQLKKFIGDPFFKSRVVFGSPRTGEKFDEILQCRYPIRLIGTTGDAQSQATGEAGDFFVTSTLAGLGYSVSLAHEAAAADTSPFLKMLSRSYAHVRLFRRFGLLLPSSVFYTPDVQLAQVRDALSSSAGKGKAVFVTASLISPEGNAQSQQDPSQFEVFLSSLEKQNWLKNVLVLLLEFPQGGKPDSANDLSLDATSAHLTFWATGTLSDSSINSPSPKIVRGIDIGASLAARLRLSSVVSQCDGTALFDVAERPSVFPRDLVYQELDEQAGKDIFRKRGWLTPDGYRLEVSQSQYGNFSKTFKILQAKGTGRFGESVREIAVDDSVVSAELSRQLDEFLRTTGVEIISLGNDKTAYSEPFRRVRLLK